MRGHGREGKRSNEWRVAGSGFDWSLNLERIFVQRQIYRGKSGLPQGRACSEIAG